MRIRNAAAALLAVGLLAGCGSSDADATGELREWLRVAHEFDNGYDGLGEVTVTDGDVTVDTVAWHNAGYGAYLYCAWVEQWLRFDGNGSVDSQIVVVMDGVEVLRSRGASETCAEAQPSV